MANHQTPVVIKKYANRRLYNTGTSSYVTLEDLAAMVRAGEDFVVRDARSGEDITRTVLTQIIFDAESKGHNLLPTTFLRQLIRLYGDSMQTLVPPFLEHSLGNFIREQERMRARLEGTFGPGAVQAMEEQARRNMELFERSMRMFMPFHGAETAGERKGEDAPPEAEAPRAPAGDLDELKSQVAAMQARIDELVRAREPRHEAPGATPDHDEEHGADDAPEATPADAGSRHRGG